MDNNTPPTRFRNKNGLQILSWTCDRRAFIRMSATMAAIASAPAIDFDLLAEEKFFEARYYEKLERAAVRCRLCPRSCTIPEGGRGYCRTRENHKGILYSLVYGQPCALHIDPIEKKPFFHVLPGTSALSLATVGCNLSCKFCQNWQISQSRPEEVRTRYTSPEEIAELAESKKAPTIAYTYGEPVVFSEYMQDIAKAGRSRKIRSVVVSNGYIGEKALSDLCGLVDAIKIDLKSFEDSYYREVCGGALEPVLRTIQSIHKAGVWLELVYLVVPTLNDDPEKIREMARWIASKLGTSVPIHFSRFFPQYKLANLPPTPVSTLDRAHKVCIEEGLKFVYIGNVPGHKAEHTYCPGCGKPVVSRSGYRLASLDIRNGACRFCGEKIPGIWE